MKAFVNSLVAIAASALLLELLLYFQAFNVQSETFQEQMFAPRYAGYYFDDISYDIRSMATDMPQLSRVNSTSVEISYSADSSGPGFPQQLAAYEEKLANITGRLNMNISINASNITSDGYTLYLSNGMTYGAYYDAAPLLSQLNSSAAASVSIFNITTLTGQSAAATRNFTLNGSGVRVIMNYTGPSASVFQDGSHDYSESDFFQANFSSNGTFTVQLSNGSGTPAFSISRDSVPGQSTLVRAGINNNGTYEVYASFPITLNITGTGFSKHGSVIAARG